MAFSTAMLERQSTWQLLPAIVKLAGWRFRQMWRFLLVTWLGMLAMVVIACAPPLFSRVAISANLRTLAADSSDGQQIVIGVDSLYPTASQLQQVTQQIENTLKQGIFASYLQKTPEFVVQAPPLALTGQYQATALSPTGYDPALIAQHTTVLQGRLPRETDGAVVEIALTQQLAQQLGVQVGATLHANYNAVGGAQSWTLQVVGIVARKSTSDTLWLADPFGAVTGDLPGSHEYSVLAAVGTVKARVATMQALPGGDQSHLFWGYPFSMAHLDANDIPALSQQASDLPTQIFSTLPHIQGVTFASPSGAFIQALINYVQQIVVLEIVVTFLLLLILAIVLFLVGMLSNMLVERQEGIIATLRSRGATRRHVFGSFVVQGIVVGLAALFAGPLLAVQLVRLIGQLLLLPANRSALDVVVNDPLQAALDVKWFALAAIIVAVVVMIVAINRSSKLDIVTLRRESSRVRNVPFWRRYNLDVLLVLLIIVGYLLYTYVWQLFSSAQGGVNSLLYNILKFGGFIAPPLLVAALLMLFLRIFPLLSRLLTRIVEKRPGAPAVLALSQVERTPRPAARVIVLLALSIATACFLFTLIATKYERTGEDAAYRVGADFSGNLANADLLKTFDELNQQYSQMPGVQSAMLGFSDTLETERQEINLMAADASKLGQTLFWPASNSTQSLMKLAAQLVTHRADATSGKHVVYALVNAVLWQQDNLSPGAAFTLPVSDVAGQQVDFIALAEVNYIPGFYDTPLDGDSNVGLIVDYQSFASAYKQATGTSFAPGYLWLRTSDDPGQLAHIRQSSPQLQDRRAIATSNQENTFHIDIVGALGIGVGAALILALIGTLLSSWLNAVSRLTSFAVMRALGMKPRELAALLLWEQGYTFVLAFLLGIGMGALLTVFAGPVVSLLDLSGPSALYNPYDIPPVQIAIPWLPLLILLGVLVLICGIALLLMARIVSRPSISQTLRLNED